MIWRVRAEAYRRAGGAARPGPGIPRAEAPAGGRGYRYADQGTRQAASPTGGPLPRPKTLRGPVLETRFFLTIRSTRKTNRIG